jgi:hypothetical protein
MPPIWDGLGLPGPLPLARTPTLRAGSVRGHDERARQRVTTAQLSIGEAHGQIWRVDRGWPWCVTR